MQGRVGDRAVEALLDAECVRTLTNFSIHCPAVVPCRSLSLGLERALVAAKRNILLEFTDGHGVSVVSSPETRQSSQTPRI